MKSFSTHKQLFVWIFLVPLFIKISAESTISSPIGYFELQILKVQNTGGELFTGGCCDGNRSEYGCRDNECDTFFRLCLKEYQVSGYETESDSCTFGSGFSDVLGHNSFSLDNTEDPNNPGRLKIPLWFTWTRTFTLILEAFDEEDATGTGAARVIDRESQLIDRHVHSGLLNPDADWHTGIHSGRAAHIKYRIRVRCNTNYYGYNCTKFCKPRDGYHGHYTCDRNGNKQCLPGWMGTDCNKPQCRLGCHSEHGSCSKPNECICEYGWKGDLCTECARYPGCVHGTCSQPWQCQCETNWGGLLCDKNLNYCGTHHPCRNGGTCTNPLPDSFQCSCLDGFSGVNCEIVEFSCTSNPCLNDGTCQDQNGQFRCVCSAGWTGRVCQTDIDDCADQPCRNGGKCIDLVNGFHCECPPHWEGATCQLDADECENSPCVHARNCMNLPGNYYCDCDPGWEGVNCDLNVDECSLNECKNGATCLDLVNAFHCSCPPGFTGKRCEVNVNECENDPCLKGGQCVDKYGSFMCICPAGFSGQRCQLNEGHCQPNPCQNGAECFNINNDYFCNCSSEYEGKKCSIPRDACRTFPCEAIDSCTIRVASNRTAGGFEIVLSKICGPNGKCNSLPDNEYECLCEVGYEGKHCELDVDDCAGVTCSNGGTCIDKKNSFTCICTNGWEGEHCEKNINDCLPDPCHGRGVCQDLVDDFYCQCNGSWKGKTCRSHFQCSENPCLNGGTCAESETAYSCVCPPMWTGKSCNLRIDSVCASNPCLNGGICVGDGETFECYCRDGFAGTRCEEDVDDCSPEPCFNEGKCIDGVNHYTCQCLNGFAGHNCRINVNECLSAPCGYDSSCVDLIGDYRCICPFGRSGKNCQQIFAPNGSCIMNGSIYPDKANWTNVCNQCTCQKGITQCTKMWCGDEKCDSKLECRPGYTCRESNFDCFSTNCKNHSMCFAENKPKHLPTTVLPSSDCRRVTLLFNLTLMQPGVRVQDICMSIRILPAVIGHARNVYIMIRCVINDVNREAIDVTISTNNATDGNDAVKAVADLLGKMSSRNSSSIVYMSALLDVYIDSRDLDTTSKDSVDLATLIVVVSIALFVVIILSLVFWVCLIQHRRRKRPSASGVDERDKNTDYFSKEKTARDVKEKHCKRSDGEISNRKISNKELPNQHKGRIILDVNELSATKSNYKSSVPVKLAVPLEEEKKLISSLPEEEEEDLDYHERGDPIYPNARILNKSSRGNRHNEELIDAVNSKIPTRNQFCPAPRSVAPVSENHCVARCHRVRHVCARQCRDGREDVAEASYAAALPHESSRLLSNCSGEACCQQHSHQCLRLNPEDEPDEAGLLASSQNPYQPCSSCHCRCHRSRSHRSGDSRHFRRSRHARLSSSNIDDPCFCTDVGSARSDSNRHPLRSTDHDLPSYDSVVHDHPASLCDCSYHPGPSSSSGHYFQSPPPSYSHPSKQHLQSWRISEVSPRSGNSSFSPCYTSGRSCCGSSSHCDSDCVNSRTHAERCHLSQNVNDIRASPSDDPSSDLLTKSVSRNAVI